LLISLYSCKSVNPEANVSVQQLKDVMDSGEEFVIVDVRTQPELSGPLGKLDDIILIPLQVLPEQIDALAEQSSKPVYVICRSGNRSQTATRILLKAGFDAHNVTGGMQAWRNTYGEMNR
jgi:rhodanese-related sulfurtransferase